MYDNESMQYNLHQRNKVYKKLSCRKETVRLLRTWVSFGQM